MRSLLVLVLVLLVSLPLQPAAIYDAGIQGSFIYCAGTSGSSCTAYGSPVFDLAYNTNWTVHWRMRFTNGTFGESFKGWILSALTSNGSVWTCSQLEIRHEGGGTGVEHIVLRKATTGASVFSVEPIVMTSTANIADLNQHDYTLTHTSANVITLYIDGVQTDTVTASYTTDSGCDMTIGLQDGGQSCGTGGTGGDQSCLIVDMSAFQSVLPLNDIVALASGAARPNLISVNPAWWYPIDFGRPANCLNPGPGFLDGDFSGNRVTQKFNSNPAGDYCTNKSHPPSTGGPTSGGVSPASGEATH